MYLAYFLEFAITWILSYVEVLNAGFGTRDILFIHYGMCGLPYGIILIAWNELRKFCVISFIYCRLNSSSPDHRFQVGGIEA